VNILREANLNPDEHLTEEQKELLLSAEYYDRLNVQTAYFPQGVGSQMEGEYGEEEEGEEEQQEAIEENIEEEDMEGHDEGEEEEEGEQEH